MDEFEFEYFAFSYTAYYSVTSMKLLIFKIYVILQPIVLFCNLHNIGISFTFLTKYNYLAAFVDHRIC